MIEATEPVPYVDDAARSADGRCSTSATSAPTASANSVAADAKSPIAGVSVEAGRVAGRAGLARAHHAVAAGRAPRAQRAQHGRRRLRPAVGEGRAVRAAAASRRGASDATPDALRARDASPAVDPIAALGLDAAPTGRGRPSPIRPAAAVAAPARRRSQPARSRRPPRSRSAGQIAGAARSGARAFTGNPVSLDFQGADLRAVLRTFAEISGLNIVIDPAVQGTVDVALRDVPWDQALDIILRANKLGYIVDGTIVRIAPLTVLADEESQRRKLADEQALAGELRVLTKTLSYAKAEELQALLDQERAVAARHGAGRRADQHADHHRPAGSARRRAIDLIDDARRAQPQVEIEARIVQTNKNYARAARRAVGLQRPRRPGARQHDATWRSRTTARSAAASAGAGTDRRPPAADRRQPRRRRRDERASACALGSVNGAFNLDVALIGARDAPATAACCRRRACRRRTTSRPR